MESVINPYSRDGGGSKNVPPLFRCSESFVFFGDQVKNSSSFSAFIMHRYPAEWEPQASVWLSWPTSGAVCKAFPPAKNVIADMAAALIGPVPHVVMLVNSESEAQEVREALQVRNADANKVKFLEIELEEEWIRDFGPIFLKSGDETIVATFGWNNWGCVGHYTWEGIEDDIKNASLVSKRSAEAMKLRTIESNLVSEGGNREFNGAGVLMATSTVELQRNPTMTLEAIEDELKRVFAVQKVIWLEEGVTDDDHVFRGPRHCPDTGLLEFNAGCTGGHIDEYAKFIGPNQVLLVEVPEDERESPLGRLTHERMEKNLSILKSSTDVNGKSFDIVRIPTPPTMKVEITRDDELWSWMEEVIFEGLGKKIHGSELLEKEEKVLVVLPASYVNMVVCNGTILIPRYARINDEPKYPFLTDALNQKLSYTDQLAKDVLQTAFPAYQIVQIPSVAALNIGGGGMHCTSQQQPH